MKLEKETTEQRIWKGESAKDNSEKEKSEKGNVGKETSDKGNSENDKSEQGHIWKGGNENNKSKVVFRKWIVLKRTNCKMTLRKSETLKNDKSEMETEKWQAKVLNNDTFEKWKNWNFQISNKKGKGAILKM